MGVEGLGASAVHELARSDTCVHAMHPSHLLPLRFAAPTFRSASCCSTTNARRSMVAESRTGRPQTSHAHKQAWLALGEEEQEEQEKRRSRNHSRRESRSVKSRSRSGRGWGIIHSPWGLLSAVTCSRGYTSVSVQAAAEVQAKA